MKILGVPDAIVGGTAKAATTSIFQILKQHPSIAPSKIKEPRYFAFCDEPESHWSKCSDERDTVIRDPAEYTNLFPTTEDQGVKIEASPIYLYSETAARAISQQAPKCKCIFILRDPIARAFSHFQHMRRDRREPIKSFFNALQREEDRIGENYDFSFHYVSMGKYFSQLQRFLKHFPREQVLVLEYERFNQSPNETINEIFDFLEIPRIPVDTAARHNISNNSNPNAVQKIIKSSNSLKRAASGILSDEIKNRIKSRAFQTPTPDSRSVDYILERLEDEIVRLDALVDWDPKKWVERNGH